jgi:hypothetical protein
VALGRENRQGRFDDVMLLLVSRSWAGLECRQGRAECAAVGASPGKFSRAGIVLADQSNDPPAGLTAYPLSSERPSVLWPPT